MTLFGPKDRIFSRKTEKRIDAAIAREPPGGLRRNRRLGRLSARSIFDMRIQLFDLRNPEIS